MSPRVSQHRLERSDGTVYYEVRGAGPLLLVIGQPMSSGPFGPVADRLAETRTVVTYDPHGIGASVMEPLGPVTPEIEADDLAAIIDAVGGGPADVFGSSGGAVAALALASRHPDKLGTVIAHEPPVTELLPDAAHIRSVIDGIEDAFHAGGSGAGWASFVGLVSHQGEVTEAGTTPMIWPGPAGGSDGDGEPGDGRQAAAEEPAPPPAPTAKQLSDDELFFVHMLRPFTRYAPDPDALRSGSPRVVVAIGAASGTEVARRSADALAAALGQAPAVFPGGHGGFMEDPDWFAARVREVLEA